MHQPPQFVSLMPGPRGDVSPPSPEGFRACFKTASDLPATDLQKAPPIASESIKKRKPAAIYLALALLTWAVFGQTVSHQFVNYDDQTYVYKNPRISAGLTTTGFLAAFTQPHAQNWHPLTTLSHMLDCQVFGLNPAGHHFVNVLLHGVAVLLLFSVLNAMTGALWRSAFVVALFAIHPLRAESVAWIAERKDVLSGVFFMLTIAAYVRYIRERRIGSYLLTALVFGMALMCKPTVVVLPVLLLLLDYWPLSRIPGELRLAPNGWRSWISAARSPVVIEKIPLLMLSLGGCVSTLLAQQHTVGYSEVALVSRLANALVSYVAYLGQIVWPTRVAVFYPDTSDQLSLVTVALSAVLLTGITILVFAWRRSRPYLLVGWFWYVICLLPVIGIVRVGLQGHADRYTYLPQIGLCIALVWSIAGTSVARFPRLRLMMSAFGIVVVIVLAWRATIQVSFWKDTESLWTHALAVTDHNDVAHNNLATLLMERGRVDEAIVHYRMALGAGSRAESRTHLSPAIVENSLGNALAQKGELAAAIRHYRKALELRPDFSDARSNLAAMLTREGDLSAAISEYQQVVDVPPEDSACHQRLAEMLVKANRFSEAVAHYRRAVELAPNLVDNINALAWLLATNSDPAIRNPADALRFATRANDMTGNKDPVVLRILAASYAASGRSAEAVTTAERAMSLAGSGYPGLASALEVELAHYRGAGSADDAQRVK